MAYPSPMGTPQFAYTPHFPATPPMYRSYGPMAYPQHATPAPEEAQGAWFFLSHGSAPPPQQYHYDGGQYQNPYAAQFSPPAVDHGTFPAQPSSRSFQPAPLPTHPGTSQSAQPTSSKAVSTEASSRPASRPPSSAAGSKPVARREWHPRPPPHRSPWVMWVGNVPSDASQDELWDFFSTDTDPGSHESDSGGAVVSIFLIARSNCAFINYSSEETLQEAIKSFHGKRLRPNDPQCPMLVCKIRRSTDDLKSGVGGQRGTGLHMQWVKEQRKLSHARTATEFSASSDASTSSRSVPDHLIDDMAAVSISAHSGPPRQRTNQSSSSESYASTSSSFLGEHFPTRYFILKSLSERDLELSVESGLWATQKHNELVLDRAYRTSTNVYLIFSVNKSGEFYGYAKMTGPIRQGEGSVSWSSRSHTSPQAAQTLPPSLQRANPIDPRLLSQSDGPVYESPEDFQRTKTPGFAAAPPTGPQPAELGKRRQEFGHYASAPAKLDGPEDDSPERSPSLKFSLDHLERRQRQARQKAPFHLDPKAPFRAMRGKGEVDGILDGEGGGEGSHSHLETVKEGLASEDGQMEAPPAKPSPTWGDCFKVDWVELRKVPFHRTRHLRNAWNKGREIKVSRDGTELESGVGKRLLAEWGELVASDGA
ncbi:YT521-B-like domain-containing protein [Ephemerocybe angulata]|uniref:YT521-B-like domain-containing protein n=1 Tax=Ephemerocybe angulata TaxID=980116 RepID=A0A8H6M7G9_9AGAR|nr:YT521-B-like domain-containing protein [Tulosesus angulatus]